MFSETVLYIIDDHENELTRQAFREYMDDLGIPVNTCVVYYYDVAEVWYLNTVSDFNKIKDSIFLQDQNEFVYIPGDNRNKCTARDRNNKVIEVLGVLKPVQKLNDEEGIIFNNQMWSFE